MSQKGSYYFSHKETFSVVLFGLVDADYRFIYMDFGCNGKISDIGFFEMQVILRLLKRIASIFLQLEVFEEVMKYSHLWS